MAKRSRTKARVQGLIGNSRGCGKVIAKLPPLPKGMMRYTTKTGAVVEVPRRTRKNKGKLKRCSVKSRRWKKIGRVNMAVWEAGTKKSGRKPSKKGNRGKAANRTRKTSKGGTVNVKRSTKRGASKRAKKSGTRKRKTKGGNCVDMVARLPKKGRRSFYGKVSARIRAKGRRSSAQKKPAKKAAKGKSAEKKKAKRAKKSKQYDAHVQAFRAERKRLNLELARGRKSTKAFYDKLEAEKDIPQVNPGAQHDAHVWARLKHLQDEANKKRSKAAKKIVKERKRDSKGRLV